MGLNLEDNQDMEENEVEQNSSQYGSDLSDCDYLEICAEDEPLE